MNIKVVIESTEPAAREGTYVYVTQDLGQADLPSELERLESWLLRAFNEMRKLQVVS